MAMETPRRSSRFLFLFGGILLLGGIVMMLMSMYLSSDTFDTSVWSTIGWLLAPVGLFTLVLAQIRRSQGK